jgi:hypothetical protein
MKASKQLYSAKAVLFPVILTISLFLGFLGMRTPDLPQTQKPTGHHRAVIENQIKEAKAGIQNSSQDFVLSRRSDLIEPTPFHASSSRPIYHSISYIRVFPIPSRAPPAFHV